MQRTLPRSYARNYWLGHSMNRPSTKDGYSLGEVARAEAACRYVCQRLGSLSKYVTIVGGLVPKLIIPQDTLPESDDRRRHLGTIDVDLGLILGVTTLDHLAQMRRLLRELHFKPDKQHAATRFRYEGEGKQPVIVDLVCAAEPDSEEIIASSLQEVDPRIARQIALAFEDQVPVRLRGAALAGEDADCVVNVCGAGAFVIIKALTFRSRGENKDAYDLFYVLDNYKGGPAGVFPRLAPLLRTQEGQKAIRVLQEDFAEDDGDGAIAVATFLEYGPNDEIQADVVSRTVDLLRMCGLGDP